MLAWSVCFSTRYLPAEGVPDVLLSQAQEVPSWLDRNGVPEGQPFLLSPEFEYDVELNSYFLATPRLSEPAATRLNRAGAVKRFLDFLWHARGRKNWRNALEADHDAYHHWRLVAILGPRISGSTWNQEVSLLHTFYGWACAKGFISSNPVPERPYRVKAPIRAQGGGRAGRAPASFAHGARNGTVEWLPPAVYRRWRDIGLGGYGADGLPDPRFRGRWVTRNRLFADFMVRTGLRLSEQAALTVFDIPKPRGVAGYVKFWLPQTIAKGGSARWIYVPDQLLQEVWDYVDFDRSSVVNRARLAKRYQAERGWRVATAVGPGQVLELSEGGNTSGVRLDQLSSDERRGLLQRTQDGLEPVALWLNERGAPMTTSGWQEVFSTASRRCEDQGVAIYCHPHQLRHTFAVVTLEQLQRGHINALAGANEAQRGQYTRVFGDPLEWVKRLLGHSSVTTTAVYLHALQELEMETRLALVPDAWDDRDPETPADDANTQGSEVANGWTPDASRHDRSG